MQPSLEGTVYQVTPQCTSTPLYSSIKYGYVKTTIFSGRTEFYN